MLLTGLISRIVSCDIEVPIFGGWFGVVEESFNIDIQRGHLLFKSSKSRYLRVATRNVTPHTHHVVFSLLPLTVRPDLYRSSLNGSGR